MSEPKRRDFCFNRDVVNVDDRLYSPKYDFEGGAGHDFWGNFEVNDRTTMCFYGDCSSGSYNAWVEATDEFINGTGSAQLTGHYKFIEKRMKSKFGGAAIPQHLKDKLDNVKAVIDEWDDAGYRADKNLLDDLRHPFTWYWEGEIKTIIEYFDNAACTYDELNKIAIAIDEESAAKAAPSRTLEELPEGGFFSGDSNKTKSNTGSNVGLVVGGLAAAGAGYLLYKVLTE